LAFIFGLEFTGHKKKIQTNFYEWLLSLDNSMFRLFLKKICFIFSKIKDNLRKWEVLAENSLVYNFTHKMDILKILKHMSLSEKVVFKDTCRWL
jgi:hypothetical protein